VDGLLEVKGKWKMQPRKEADMQQNNNELFGDFLSVHIKAQYPSCSLKLKVLPKTSAPFIHHRLPTN